MPPTSFRCKVRYGFLSEKSSFFSKKVFFKGSLHEWQAIREAEKSVVFPVNDRPKGNKIITQKNKNMSEIDFRIAEILGRSTIENGMEVSKDIQQLAYKIFSNAT